MRKPTHPGKILKKHYMEPLNLDLPWLADDLGISQQALADIIDERQPINEEIAQKLAKAFNTTPDLWTNLQKKYDKTKVGSNPSRPAMKGVDMK